MYIKDTENSPKIKRISYLPSIDRHFLIDDALKLLPYSVHLGIFHRYARWVPVKRVNNTMNKAIFLLFFFLVVIL